MPYHRFKVGQIVVARSKRPDAVIPRGPHVIVRLLPLFRGNSSPRRMDEPHPSRPTRRRRLSYGPSGAGIRPTSILALR